MDIIPILNTLQIHNLDKLISIQNCYFEFISYISEGANGKVYSVRNIIDKKLYAIKQIKLLQFEQKCLREVIFMSRASHKNIVKYNNTWIDHDSIHKSKKKHIYLYIQMEYCQTNLVYWLHNKQVQYSDLIFSQILSGLKFIHENYFIHRDLKPSNILLVYTRDKPCVKISDFGSVTVTNNKYIDSDIIDIFTRNYTTTVGTELYCAPELFTNDYDERVDIYATGIIYFEILYMWYTEMERVTKINKLKTGILDDLINFQKDFILHITNQDYRKRPKIHKTIKQFKTCVAKVADMKGKLT